MDAKAIVRQLRFFYGYPMRYRKLVVLSQLALLIAMLLAVAIPLIIREAVDRGILGGNPTVLFAGAASVSLVGCVAVALTHIGKCVRFTVATRAVTDLRRDVFRHILQLGPVELKGATGGQALTRLTTDTTSLRPVTNGGLFELINQGLLGVAVLVVALALDWKLTLLAFVPQMVAALVTVGVQARLQRMFREIREHFSSLVSGVSESLHAIHVVKAFGREEHQTRQLSDINQRVARQRTRMRMANSLFSGALQVLAALSAPLVLWVGAVRVAEGDLTVGTLVAVLALTMMLHMATHMLTMGSNGLFQAAVAAERLMRLMETQPAVVDRQDAADPPPLAGAIEVERLSVELGGRTVLAGVSLEVRPGEFVAITGPTGSGKSLLLASLARLHEATAGTIRFDGRDARHFRQSTLRRQVVYLPQQPWLFAGSIAQNIAFAWPEAPAERVRDAARRAGLGDLSLERLIGAGAAGLSGGERQRVALARALLLDAPVLLLDNPTANLDAETEARLVETIAAQRGQRTLVLATPHLSVARHADRVLILDHGHIVEEGAPDALWQRDGLFAAMHAHEGAAWPAVGAH